MDEKSQTEKSREQIMAEREAKKLAKQSGKIKLTNTNTKKNEISKNLVKDNSFDTVDCTNQKHTIKNIIPITEKNSIELSDLKKEKNLVTSEIVQSIIQPEKVKIISTEKLLALQQKDSTANSPVLVPSSKSREQILAEREAKKQAKQISKTKINTVTSENIAKPNLSAINTVKPVVLPKSNSDLELAEKMHNLHLSDDKKNESKSKVTTKAERRALQEAQRAAKAKVIVKDLKLIKKSEDHQETKVIMEKVSVVEKKITKIIHHRVKLFSHLYEEKISLDCPLNIPCVHPAVIKLGVQYTNGIVVGSNARCVAFFYAMKEVIKDYQTPPQKEFSRGIEKQLQMCMSFLHKCRPISVSMSNALKYIKQQLRQILKVEESEAESKIKLLEAIDTYIREQIDKAAEAISSSVQEKISNDDVILTFGCSSLIQHILFEAHDRHKVDFRVIVVDARPLHEGQEMLRRLVSKGIQCTCILINAVGFIMPEVTKVILGAHALLANGYVMSRAGTAQIAMIAKSFNVPFLVCCETHKFSERVQTDAFVYNEIGDPNDLILKSGTLENNKHNYLANWSTIPNLTPLHLYYDVTPPELVTAVVTEVAILPCTSVPVILRIKPTEIGY